MGMISNIYAGPMAGIRSTNTKVGMRLARGSKSKVWRSGQMDKPSDTVPTKGVSKVIDKWVDIHTPNGVIRGVNVQRGKYGLYVILQHHELKVTHFGDSVYIQKGYALDQCQINSYHRESPIQGIL